MRDEFVRTQYEQQFDALARVALVFGAIAVLALVPLDLLVAPQHFGAFTAYRLATALTLLLLLAVLRRRVGFSTRLAITLLAGTAVATMLALMIKDLGGHHSVYFAGFILILVYVSCFLPLPAAQGIAITAVVYALYLLPILAYDTIRDAPFFLSANVLMLACAASMLLLQQITYRRMLDQYALRFELEQQRSLLEERGRERTAALEQKVGELQRSAAEVGRLNADLEERVHARTRQLQEANRELESFSYSISHDLRSPLRAIHGFTSILQSDHRERLDGEGRRLLERIAAGATRMDALVSDLLAFCRLGRDEARLRETAPGFIVGTVIEEVRAAEPARAVEVVVGELPACRADPAMLQQVFANLLANAFKYTRRRPDARVEVGCRREQGLNVYFVSDNGAGFDMAHASRLFGVFQRLHREEEFEGTGIGLALVRRIVEKHGGSVWAQAALDRGATFSFTLEPPRTPPA